MLFNPEDYDVPIDKLCAAIIWLYEQVFVLGNEHCASSTVEHKTRCDLCAFVRPWYVHKDRFDIRINKNVRIDPRLYNGTLQYVNSEVYRERFAWTLPYSDLFKSIIQLCRNSSLSHQHQLYYSIFTFAESQNLSPIQLDILNFIYNVHSEVSRPTYIYCMNLFQPSV